MPAESSQQREVNVVPKKVLIVDDSPTVRQQVSLALKQAGLEVVEATDGVEGLKAIASDRSIGLVVLDINMPNMNGLDMLEAVKADRQNAQLPVILLTSEGQPALMERGKRAGAKGWIVKPFKAELLVAAVKKLIMA
ncbi:MAG: response regulator [Myxococcaceae bacterium]|nr:response regulator [Myxococcaceae bacterium]